MQAVVDRIEGDTIVLELDEDEFVQIPLADAPPEVREGAVVCYEDGKILAVDEIATAQLAEQTRALLERLKKKN